MPEGIANSDAQYAFDIVQRICKQVGPGLPCSSQERERATVVQKELALYLGAENVVFEEFTVAPDAFLASLPISAVFMLLAALLNISTGRFPGVAPWITAIAALAFSILSILLVVFEFVLGLELIDPLFKKKQSVNVIGILRKSGTNHVKRLLILSGHHDSALENTWLHYLGSGFLIASATWFLGLLSMLVLSSIQLAGLIIGSDAVARIGTLQWFLLIYPIIPSVIYALFFNMGRKNGGTVPGAVDNLSGCALVVSMCRCLVNNPAFIPADTEIRFITFGSEEAGVRGSRRYVARHLEELKRLDARLLNFEMVADPEISILATDVNGTVQNSPEMVKSVVTAAERAGVPYKVQSASYGGPGLDAAPFSQAGLKATSLLPFKMPEQMLAFYHQKWDTPEVMTLEPLLNVLKLTLEWVRSGGEAEC